MPSMITGWLAPTPSSRRLSVSACTLSAWAARASGCRGYTGTTPTAKPIVDVYGAAPATSVSASHPVRWLNQIRSMPLSSAAFAAAPTWSIRRPSSSIHSPILMSTSQRPAGAATQTQLRCTAISNRDRRRWPMELRQLRYFVTVAEELHFGKAAERLGIVQPAVSQQVARLEREFGLLLLDRSSRHVRLTNDGERLLQEARAVLAAADRTAEVAAELV